MKMTKKKVFVTALALCLVAIISMGTLAWFTATDEVENIFKVSTDDETQKPDFKLDLFEHKLEEDGTLGEDEVDGNTYNHIAHGAELPKDPTVRNDGAYDMWVRVKVTLDDYAAWEEIMGEDYDFYDILTGVSSDWALDSATIGTDTLVFYKNTELVAGATSTLFTGVEIPGEEFTVDNMPTEFSLKLVAEAIQSDNTGDSAKAAFDAYWD